MQKSSYIKTNGCLLKRSTTSNGSAHQELLWVNWKESRSFSWGCRQQNRSSPVLNLSSDHDSSLHIQQEGLHQGFGNSHEDTSSLLQLTSSSLEHPWPSRTLFVFSTSFKKVRPINIKQCLLSLELHRSDYINPRAHELLHCLVY